MRHLLIASLCTSALLISGATNAQMDVDDADSLRFQSFHEKKDTGIKIYDSKKGGLQIGESKEVKKVYEPAPTADADAASTATPSTVEPAVAAKTAPVTTTATTTTESATVLPQGKKGQRFEIRERYSLKPYATNTAASAIEAAYRQMAAICPSGWEVIREFSVPTEGDFYKHYEFECM